MQKYVGITIAVFLAMYIQTAGAAVPETINLQGRLADGTNLVNGSTELIVKLFDGESGSEVYAETQQVMVVDGLYSLQIGASNGAPGSLMAVVAGSDALWLELTVDGTPLSPREPFGSVSYALRAESVSAGAVTSEMIADGTISNTDISASASISASQLDVGSIDHGLLSGLGDDDHTQYLERDGSDTMAGHLNLGGYQARNASAIGVGTANPTKEIHVVGDLHLDNGTEDISVPNGQRLQIGHWDGTNFTERMQMDGSGNFGIGTDDPTQPLIVAGDAIVGGGVLYGKQDGNSEFVAIRGQTQVWFMAVQNEAAPQDSDFFIGKSATEDGYFHIQSLNGNVGIGTSSPAEKLDVAGDIRTAGIFKYDSSRSFLLDIPSTAFVPTRVYTNVFRSYFNSELFVNTLTGGVYRFLAPVDLPDEATISDFTVYYRDSSFNYDFTNLTATLFYKEKTSNNNNVPIATLTTNGPDYSVNNSFQMTTKTGANSLIESTRWYGVELTMDHGVGVAGNHLSFYGVEIEYYVNRVTD